jgi:hypothetical protein
MQLLKKAINLLLEYQGESSIDFKHWKLSVQTPELGDEQQNGWACGYFVISAMEIFSHNESSSLVTADSAEWMRVLYCDAYRKFPLRCALAWQFINDSAANSTLLRSLPLTRSRKAYHKLSEKKGSVPLEVLEISDDSDAGVKM